MRWSSGTKHNPTNDNRVVDGIPISYTFYLNGTTYYAEACSPGLTDYSGSNGTTVLQNAIDGLPAAGGIIVLKGAVSLAEITIPKNAVTLQGEGDNATVITYTGSATFLKSSNQTQARDYCTIRDLKITTSTGLTGIDWKGFDYGGIHNVHLHGFSAYGIKLDGTTIGCYFNAVDQCIIDLSGTSGVGIYLTGGGGGSANKNYIYRNRFSGCNVGILADSGSVAGGNTLLDNNIEGEVGATPVGIKYEGDNSLIMGNWIEATATFDDGIYVRGGANMLLNNKFVNCTTEVDYDASGTVVILEPNIPLFVIARSVAIDFLLYKINMDFNFNAVKDFVVESKTDATRGAAGNAGRWIFNTDDGQPNYDDGVNWRDINGNIT